MRAPSDRQFLNWQTLSDVNKKLTAIIQELSERTFSPKDDEFGLGKEVSTLHRQAKILLAMTNQSLADKEEAENASYEKESKQAFVAPTSPLLSRHPFFTSDSPDRTQPPLSTASYTSFNQDLDNDGGDPEIPRIKGGQPDKSVLIANTACNKLNAQIFDDFHNFFPHLRGPVTAIPLTTSENGFPYRLEFQDETLYDTLAMEYIRMAIQDKLENYRLLITHEGFFLSLDALQQIAALEQTADIVAHTPPGYSQ